MICIIGIAHIGHLALYAGCLNPVIVLCAVIITVRTLWIAIYTIGVSAQHRTRSFETEVAGYWDARG